MANKRANKTIARETAPTDKATMVVTLYDGTREPIEDKDFLISQEEINAKFTKTADALNLSAAVTSRRLR